MFIERYLKDLDRDCFLIFRFSALIGPNWHNWAKMPTFDRNVVESSDKAQNVYFDELSNFVEQTFFVGLLVFEIIEIIG